MCIHDSVLSCFHSFESIATLQTLTFYSSTYQRYVVKSVCVCVCERVWRNAHRIRSDVAKCEQAVTIVIYFFFFTAPSTFFHCARPSQYQHNLWLRLVEKEHSNKRKQRQLNALLHFPRCMLSAVFAISLRRINTRRQSGFFPLYNDVAQKYCHLCTTRSHLHSFTPSLFFSVPLHSAPFHSLIVSLSVGSAHAEFHPIQKFKLIRFPKSLPFKIFETFCQR